jgi:3-dehydroquinate dehydratase/shikimate dehydrogenase
MTAICVPITVESVDQALADAALAKRDGATIVEWRIDSFFHGASSASAGGDDADTAIVAQLINLIERSPLPCILTCRVASEGGDYDADDADRISLFEKLTAASEHPPRYLDVEWSSFSRSANLAQKVRLCVEHPRQLRDLKTSLVLSTHDFQGRPADLLRRVLAMRDESAASIVKVAYRARSLHDSLELLDLPRQLAKPTIALGMGEFGVLSRILAPKFGSFLTFAALRPQQATAPGQPTLRELIEQYRFKSINQKTRVFGIIGHPVAHSLSPLVHNAAFARANEDAVYVPLPIAGYEDADLSFAAFRAALMELIEHPTLSFSGASVTMPHKANLARLAVASGWTMDAATRATGAANTLIVRRDRDDQVLTCEVCNTDAPALAHCLELAAQRIVATEPLRVGVVGAGGAGLAAAFAGLSLGRNVVLYNRDIEKAQTAASRLEPFAKAVGERLASTGEAAPKIVSMPLEALPKACCDVFIQCTSVGMGDTAGRSAIPIDSMTQCPASPRVALIETIYHPLETAAIRAAREAGWQTIDGATMFVEQAALQSKAWLGDAGGTGLTDTRAHFDQLIRTRLAQQP